MLALSNAQQCGIGNENFFPIKKLFFKDIEANHNYVKTLTPFYVSFEKILGYLGDMGDLCELIKRYIGLIWFLISELHDFLILIHNFRGTSTKFCPHDFCKLFLVVILNSWSCISVGVCRYMYHHYDMCQVWCKLSSYLLTNVLAQISVLLRANSTCISGFVFPCLYLYSKY